MGALGAGVSLAVASSIMLLVVSSVIAFNGWPDDLAGASAPDVAALSDAQSSAARAATADVVALPRPVAGPASSRRESDRPRSAVLGQDDSSSPLVDKDASGNEEIASGPGGTPSESSGQSTTSGGSAELDSVRQVTEFIRTTDVVPNTTGAIAVGVAPVAPSVSGTLQSIGAAGADTVDRVVQTVDGVVETVDGVVAPVLNP